MLEKVKSLEEFGAST